MAGRGATLADASAKAYLAETELVPFLGGASMTLRHGKTVSVLQSDLDSPVKERRVDLYFEDGLHARGWYPVDGTDGSQRLCLFDQQGALRVFEKFWSDPMTDLFAQAYRYFLGAGPAPLATLQMAAESVHLALRRQGRMWHRARAGGDPGGGCGMRRQISFFSIAKTYHRQKPAIERNIAEMFGTGDFGN